MKTNLTITTFRCYKLSSAARLSAEIKVLHKEQNFTFKTVKLAFIITIWLFSEFPTNLLNKWGKELRLKAVKSSLRKTSKTFAYHQPLVASNRGRLLSLPFLSSLRQPKDGKTIKYSNKTSWNLGKFWSQEKCENPWHFCHFLS